MTKYEFLYVLRETLENALTPSQVEEQVQYYSNYIEEQIRMGYTEAQVLAELGDARSIARNIIDGIEASHSNAEYSYENNETMDYSNMGNDKVDKFKAYAKLAAVLLVVFIVLIALTRLIILALPTILTIAFIVWIIKKINGQ